MDNKKELKSYKVDSETKEFVKEQIEFFKNNRDRIKLTILAMIKDLEGLIKSNDKFILLTHLTEYINDQGPTDHYNINIKKLPCYLEYALSLVSSIKSAFSKNIPIPEVRDDFIKKIIQMFDLIQLFYNTEDRNKEETEKEIRVSTILGYILNRGNAYPLHHNELLIDLFEPQSKFLKENFNFTIQDFQKNIINIGNQINNNRKQFFKFLKEAKEGKKELNNETINAFHESFRQIYEIKPSDQLSEEFLQLFSIQIGSNEEFYNWTDPYWPLNNSQIYEKPLLKENNLYYGYGIAILNTNTKEILENLIQIKSPYYYDRSYDKARAKVLERLSIKYFQKIFPNSLIYGRLLYPLDNNPNNKTDTDGLIIFDGNLLIIEAKANHYNIPAKRGSIKAIKDFMENTINLAYLQAIRTKKYIQKEDIAKFEDENGNKFQIKKKDIKSYFLVNTTLEKLNHLSSNLHEIKKLGFIQGIDWPWTVYINDLRIISEVIESPSIFVAYLIERLEENNRNKLMTTDEIDFLMYYFQDRMGIFNKNLKEIDFIAIDQMTMKLDEYYYLHKPKPLLNLPENIKKIIFNLDTNQKSNFSTVCLKILKLSPENICKLDKNLKNHRKISRLHKKDKISFYKNDENDFLLVLIVRNHIETLDLTESKNIVMKKMEEYKNIHLTILLIENIKEGKFIYDFEILKT